MTEDKPISLRSQSVFAPYIKDFVEQKQSLGLNCNVRQLGSISLILPITKPKVLKITPLNIIHIRVC